jgi:hypothetical protein
MLPVTRPSTRNLPQPRVKTAQSIGRDAALRLLPDRGDRRQHQSPGGHRQQHHHHRRGVRKRSVSSDGCTHSVIISSSNETPPIATGTSTSGDPQLCQNTSVPR